MFDIVNVSDRCPVIPIPIIKHKSEIPTNTSALTAVLNAALLPISIIANNVTSKPSQKNNITTRLLAITAPFVIASEIRRYAKNWLELFLSFMKVMEYSVIKKQNEATARIMKLLKWSILNENSIPKPAQGTEYIMFLLNSVTVKQRSANVINNAKNPVIFRIDFGITKINKPAIKGSNINNINILIIL
jgi:hypothetical protein